MRKLLPIMLIFVFLMGLTGCGNGSTSVAIVGSGILSSGDNGEITIEKIERAYKDAGYELAFRRDESIKMTGAVEKYSTSEMGVQAFYRFENQDMLNKSLLDFMSDNVFVVNGYWVLANPDSHEVALVFKNIKS